MLAFLNTLLWEFYAVGYDALTVSLPHRQLRRDVVSLIKKNRNFSVLDIGCGTGSLLLEISGKFPKAQLIGIDLSAVMLLWAKAKTFFWQRQIMYHRMPTDQLSQIQTNSADLILSVNSIFALPELEQVSKEIDRILKPGGQIIIVTPSPKFTFQYLIKLHCRMFAQLPLLNQLLLLFATICLLPLWLIILVANLLIDLLAARGKYCYHTAASMEKEFSKFNFTVDKSTSMLDGAEVALSLFKS